MLPLSARRLSALALSTVALGCDGDLVLKNGRPSVTWVETTPIDANTSALTLWVKDAEGDAVDVTARWEVGSQSGDLVLAPGSAPLTALPTELGLTLEEGQIHRVQWDLTGVPAGALTLVLTVDDRPYKGDDGDTFRVTDLDPRADSGPLPALRP
jgi:hypothetical protein